MDSPVNNIVESTSNDDVTLNNGRSADVDTGDTSSDDCDVVSTVEESQESRPQAPKRPHPEGPIIEISDTDSDDSDVCAVTSYKASADEVKRIRGDDYQEGSSSSSSSNGASSSSSESEYDDDEYVILHERQTKPKVRGALFLRAARTDEPIFNPHYLESETIAKLKKHWSECSSYEGDELSLITKPFKVCLLHNLLENCEYIHNMVDDMNTLEWTRRKMDLYEYHQTSELANLTWQTSIRGIYHLLKGQLMPWVARITETELTSISVSCSLYGPGDHLLPHDDLMSDRRVAFILYLAPWTPTEQRQNVQNGDTNDESNVVTYGGESSKGWCRSMGGALQLFDDEHHVTTQLFPQNNTLAFFKVGPETRHQVAEVTSLELPRLSINGWFHGPGDTPDIDPPPFNNDTTTPHNHTVVISEWLSPTYMSTRTRAQAQHHMETESEISLPNFILQEKYELLLQAFRDTDVQWEDCGPPELRRHRRVSAAWLDLREPCHPLKGICQLLTSQTWCRFLHEITDLHMTHLARAQLEMWTAGDYTLLPPREQYSRSRLDVLITFGVDDIRGDKLTRAMRQYVCPEEEDGGGEGARRCGQESLVCVPHTNNSLVMVYADIGAASYTTYMSKLSMKPGERFYVVSCTYYE